MRALDMEKMLRDIDQGKGPKHASETKPFYDKYRKPEDGAEKKTKRTPQEKRPEGKSNLPKGVSQSPMGDIGMHRQMEAKMAGGFKKCPMMSASSHFMKGSR